MAMTKGKDVCVNVTGHVGCSSVSHARRSGGVRSVSNVVQRRKRNERRCRSVIVEASHSAYDHQRRGAALSSFESKSDYNGMELTSTNTEPMLHSQSSSQVHSQMIPAYAGETPPPPELLARLQGVTTSLFMQRIIRLGGAVDDDMANIIVAQLLYLDSIDKKKDVVMYINSPGGSVTAGMAVFDTMRHVRPDVSTCCVGLAASMGAFLLASGEKGKRFSLPNSRIMIHQPLGGAQGQAADMEIQANEILHHKLTLNGYLSNFTGQTIEKITEDTDRDFFMSSKEAVDYGLIDAVVVHPLAGIKYERDENYNSIVSHSDTVLMDDDIAREAAKAAK